MSRRKVGPKTAMLLDGDIAESHERVDLVQRVMSGAGAGTGALLAGFGATTRTAGDVVTASCPIRSVEAVAGIDEIASVELSRALHREDGPTGADAGPTAPA